MQKKYFLLFIISLSLFSCDKNRIYELNTDIKNNNWTYIDKKDFEFNITKTNSIQALINFRHTSNFSSRNIILLLQSTNPKGIKDTININIPLSEPNGMWYGKCSGNICNIQYPLDFNFTDTGKYIFSLQQNMRKNPLPNAMSIGIRIENKIK